MDLAVGVIIGAAFSKIVDSIVNDLMMPIVGIGFEADFSNLYIPLSSKVTSGLALADARKLGPVFAWGSFVTILINFLILAFIIFLVVKAVNKFLRLQASIPPPPTPTEQLLTEIRDALKK